MSTKKSKRQIRREFIEKASKNERIVGVNNNGLKHIIKEFYEFAETKGFTTNGRKIRDRKFKGHLIFPWQKQIVYEILRSIFCQVSLSLNISIIRQVGKSEIVALLVAFIWKKFFKTFSNPISIAVIAPTRDTAKVIFRRVYKYLDADDLWIDTNEVKESQRGDRLALYGIYDEYKGTTIEGQTFDFVIRDEAHLGNDQKFIDQVLPAVTSKRAPVVQIGNGGFQDCFFYEALQRGNIFHSYNKETRLIKWTYHECRPIMEFYANSFKVQSCKTRIDNIDDEIKKYGMLDPAVRKNYFCEWMLEFGNVTTKEYLKKCHRIIDKKSGKSLYMGLDFATKHDRTVATIINENREVIDWIVVKDKDEMKLARVQCEELFEHCKSRGYLTRLDAIGFDATGQSEGLVTELLDNVFSCDLIPYKFSNQSKHEWYMKSIASLNTEYPQDRLYFNPLHEWGEQFQHEWLKLEKKMPRKGAQSGLKPSYGAPKKANAFDDFCASLAIVIDLRSQYEENFSDLPSPYNFQTKKEKEEIEILDKRSKWANALEMYA